MSEEQGVCAFIPFGNEDPSPPVFGMGILVSEREVVTCAHVIDTVLGYDWQQSPDAIVRLWFPFSPIPLRVIGRVDKARWYPNRRGNDGRPFDIAVVVLEAPPPSDLERARLKPHVLGSNVSAYGFRGAIVDKLYQSHQVGEHVPATVAGSLPGGRVQFGGILPTDPRVEGGYSGGGVYDPRQDAIVGMTVKADRDKERRVFQFINVPSLLVALGHAATGPGVNSPRNLRVVLCYSPRDATRALQLQSQLAGDGFAAWTPDNLPFEERTQERTRDAFREADVLIVCLSKEAERSGHLGPAISQALDIARELPEGPVLLIPLKLKPCDVPSGLQRWPAVNLYDPDGYDLLRAALQARANSDVEATSLTQAAQILDPRPGISGPAFARLASDVAAQQRYGTALRLALRALERMPKDESVLSNAAEYADFVHDTGTAVSLLERLTALLRVTDPGDALTRAEARLEAHRRWLAEVGRSTGPIRKRIEDVARIAYCRLVSGPRSDYVAVSLLGLLPIVTSVAVGVSDNVPGYTGYFRTHWPSVNVILPLAFILMRRAFHFMVPVASEPPVVLRQLPPILKVTGLRPGRDAMDPETPLSTEQLHVYRSFISRLCGPRVFLWAVGIATCIQVADISKVLSYYIGYAFGGSESMEPSEKDWSVMFLTGRVGVLPNLLHVAAAYAVQYMLIVVALLLCVMFILHNHFFLSRIFQRRIHQWKDAETRITVDPNDPRRCFGFAQTYEAFNVQVSTLFCGGVILLTSRWANVSPEFHKAMLGLDPIAILKGNTASVTVLEQTFSSAKLFRDIGQSAIAIGWLVFVGVVSLPALVKFLPLLPRFLLRALGLGRAARVLPYRVEYLREYFPLTIWQSFGKTDEEIASTVLHGVDDRGRDHTYGFKHQSFWPTGDRKAFVLFVFAFTVLTGLFFPMPLPFIVPSRPHVLVYLAFVLVGLAITTVLFAVLKVSLWWVDGDL